MRILIFVFVTLAVIFGFTQFIRRTSMFFPDRYPEGMWNTATLPLQPEEHFFTTRDRVRLHAWLFRARDAHAPVMIWFHGNGGNLTHRADMAAEFARRGVSVFLFDYRGYGRSGGTPSESGLFDDSLAAYDYTANELRAAAIALYGESLGGPYAAYVAKHRKATRVVLENTFPSLRVLGNTLYHPIPLGLAAPFALRTTDWLNDAGLPVLVMHGQRDGVIPYVLGQQLYDGLRVPKQLLTSPTAGHSEIPLIEGERYYRAVVTFVRG